MNSPGAAETVERIAVLCRAEQLVFALLGDGASRFASPAIAPELLAAADHAAWRAKRWYELLPTAPPGPDALLVPTEGDREVAVLARDAIVDGVTLLAVVAIELLPRIRRTMEQHLDRATGVADGPVRRILGIALTDLETDLGALLAAFERELVEPADRDRADHAAGTIAAVAARLAWPVPGV